MRYVLGIALAVAALCAQATAQDGDGTYPKRFELEAHGTHYFVDVPRAYFEEKNAKVNYPLVVALHGSGDTAANFITGFWRLRDRGYLIAAPKSPGMAWGGGEDELVFAMISEVAKAWRVDGRRVSLAGFSAGAFFGMPLVFRHPEKFNALVAIGGGGSVSVRREATGIHVHLVAGEFDPVRPTLESVFQVFKKKKLDVTYRTAPGIGHVWPPEPELKRIWDWFATFSPEALKAKEMAKHLEAARRDVKRRRYKQAIARLLPIAGAEIACPARAEAAEILEGFAVEVREVMAETEALVMDGKASTARSRLMRIWRKYEGLPEAEEARRMADALK